MDNYEKTIQDTLELASELKRLIREQDPTFEAVAIVSFSMAEASSQENSVQIRLLERHAARIRDIIAERKAKEET